MVAASSYQGRFLKGAGRTLGVFSCVALVACSSAQEREAKYLQRGTEAFEQGDLAKARIDFKNAQALAPKDAEPYYRLGLVDEAEGDLHNAFDNFIRAEQQNPHYDAAVFKIAQYYLAAGQLDQVQPRVTSLLADQPGSLDFQTLKAAVDLRLGNVAASESEANTVLTQSPGNVSAVSVLTGVYLAEGDAAKAEAILNEGLIRAPDNLSLLRLKLSVGQKLKDQRLIESALTGLVKTQPDNIAPRSDLADILVKSNRLDAAEALWRQGVANAPNDAKMRLGLVQFLGDHRSLDAAETEIHAYMQDKPNDDAPYFWLADLYQKHQANDRAAALLQTLVEKRHFEPSGLIARTALARLNFIKGNPAVAVQLIGTVLAKDAGNRDALLLRAQLSFDHGAYESAVSDLRTVLRTTPNDTEALQVLGEALFRTGRLNLAADTLDQVVDIDATNVAARVRLAQFEHLNNNNDHAAKLLAEVTKLRPDYVVGWESTARIAIDRKDWQTAGAAIDKLATLKDQTDTATMLRGAVLAGQGKDAEAVPLFEGAVKADPNAPLADYAVAALIDSRRRLGQLDQAMTLIDTLNSHSPVIIAAQASLAVELKKPDRAAQILDAAIAGKTIAPQIYADRARLFAQDNQLAQGIAVLQQGLAATSGDTSLALALSEFQSAAGQYSDAIATLDDLLGRSPALEVAANNMASLIADHQFTDAKALEKARQAVGLLQASTDPAYLDTAAWVYYRLGNINQALVLMQRCAQDGPMPPQLHYHYGAILMRAGRKEQAKPELEAALNTNGAAYPGIDEARQLLQ